MMTERAYSIGKLVDANLEAFPPAAMERFILWTSALKPSLRYGRHYVELRLVLRGPLGAVSFAMYTGWDHSDDRHSPDGMIDCLDGVRRVPYNKPIPVDFSVHSPTPLVAGESIVREHCVYLGGKSCYGGLLWLREKAAFDALTDEGEQAFWDFMRAQYEEKLDERRDGV